MSASIDFREITKMLDQCAPGWSFRQARHCRIIAYNAKKYRTFPKYDSIEVGHVRKMVRFLKISLECATKALPQLAV